MRTIDARFKVNPEVYKLLPKDKISDMTSNVEEKMYWMKRGDGGTRRHPPL